MTLQDETTLVGHDEDDDLASIPLPEITRRTEKRRLRAIRQRERRAKALRYAGIAAAGLLVLFLLGTLWPSGGKTADNDGAKAAAPPAASSPPILIAQADGAGNAVSMLLLVPAAKDKGGTVLLIPPGTMTEVASLGLEPVGKSLGLGGAQRLDATVENLLGVSIEEVLVFDDAALAGLLQPAGPLSIRVDKRVEQVNPTGQVDILYEPGVHRLEPSQIPALLGVKGQDNDLGRLVRHQAFMDAWLGALKHNPAAIPPQPPGLNKALKALVAGTVDARVLPVRAMGTTDAGELFQVEAQELRALVGSVFPGQRAGSAVRPRLQILNGTGAVGLAQRVSDRLLSAGVEVKLTGNAGRLDYEETQIVFYRGEDQAAAERVQKALGVGRIVLSRNPVDVVDVTVIVGRDFQPA